MNPGELRNRITLQVKTIVQDEELNSIEVWVDWKTVWCAALPKVGREYFRLQTMNSEIEEVFKIRHIGGVTSHMRAVFKGKPFDIISAINPEERNIELLLTCKAVV